MTVLSVLAAVALAQPLPELFELQRPVPEADYGGDFDRAPVYHFHERLPGPPINAVSHAEWSNPVLVGPHILVGSASAKALFALSRQDGSVQQVFAAGASVEAGATVHEGLVYFGDTGGNTFCYSLEDGAQVWKHDGNAPILVAPTVSPDGRRVLVTNVNDLAVALRASTGELEWQYRAKRDLTREAELSLYAAPRARIEGDEVILGFSNGTVVGVELETGEELWTRSVGEGRYPDIVADPVIRGRDLYTSGYFRPLVAIDLPSRNIRWRVDAGSAHPVALVEQEGSTTVLHPGTDGKLRAVNALTGAVLWSWDSGTSGALTTPVVTDAGLVVASSEGGVYLVDAASGEERWRWHERWRLQGVSSVPAVDGRQMVFLSNAGMVYSMLAPKRTVKSGVGKLFRSQP